MTVNATTAPRPVQPATGPARDAPPQAARDIADRFAAAVRQGAAPLPGKAVAQATQAPLANAIALPPSGLLPRPPLPAGLPTTADATPRRPRLDPEMPELALASGALAAPAGPAAVAPPPATVDPSAFADLMNQLWLREQHKATKEVRVRFGDAAWPATGARLLRLDDGSLDIQVSIGRHAHGGDLDALRRQLAERGLAVASIIVAEDS